MMHRLELSLPTPPENLALDEALLDQAEAGERPTSLLRLWESPTLAVVVGRSSPVAVEVNCPACRAAGVPIFRRTSGGGAVVLGPGCLVYSLILSFDNHPHLRMIDQAHKYVLDNLAAAVARLLPEIEPQGISDLALGNRKVSGNSLRVRRRHLLYHGTLLYDFPLDQIAALLGRPPRPPEYRASRSHADFVANLPTTRQALSAALINQWRADEPWVGWPREETARLARERYEDPAWNLAR